MWVSLITKDKKKENAVEATLCGNSKNSDKEFSHLVSNPYDKGNKESSHLVSNPYYKGNKESSHLVSNPYYKGNKESSHLVSNPYYKGQARKGAGWMPWH